MIKNLKKVISTVAAVATLASSASALAVSFPDVDEAASYAGAVEALVALGVVNGDENGKFNPDNSVTRAEFAKMVVEALGDGDAAASSSYTKFADAQGHWAAGYIETGVAKQFINGYDENTFGPDDTVTYAQAIKMLVGACGYDLWAQNQGGWPSGYLAYGSSLDIVNGVAGTVSNDTALTRAQCAVLIYNALKAPILAVNGYEYDNLGNLVPQYEAQDGKNNRDWASMLTEYHDAYVVKGRVTATAKTAEGALEADEVKFDVELSDNYKENVVVKGSAVKDEIMYVGTTNAADLLFTYSEAIVQIDEDTDEATLVAITPYGANKTVEIDADLIRTEDEANGTNPFYHDDADDSKDNKKPQLAVAKSESSSATTKYDLAVKDNADAVELYVNGKNVTWNLENFTKFIKNNTTATVTLIDATQEGSTSTDGKYDYIMVNYYASAVVDSVSVSDSSVKIYFKESTNGENRLDYDPEDEDITVSFTKDGAEFNPADLVEFDVVSVAYDVTDWDNSTYYEVYVSSNAPVTGMLKSYDDEENTLNIDGTDYEAVPTINVAGYELSGEYTLYLDAMGNVAYVEEGSSSKNYGIIVGAYESNSYDYPVVRMVTGDGEIKIIETKSTDVANKVKKIIEDADATHTVSGTTYLQKTDLTKDMIKNLVVDYKLSSGKIRDIETVAAANNSATIEYKETSNKLGNYALSEAATKFVVIEDYLNGGSDVGTIELSALEDEVEYEAFVYGKNKNTAEYQFVVVLGGLASVRDDSDWGIVKANAKLTEVDDEKCYEVTVVRGADEVTVSVSEDAVAAAPAEGDVIAYSVGTKGYVENGYYYIVADGASVEDYSALYEAWVDGDFEKTAYAKGIIKKGTDDFDEDEADIIFAPVYKKTNNNLEVFTGVADDKSDVNVVESYTIGSEANVYVYDYAKAKKFRVDAGFVPNQNTGIFKPALEGSELETLNWSKVKSEGIAVNYALIKTVDGDVTDVVIYVAD